ncbi:MAG: transcriptional repressor LexA [Armatimonadota bacterium]|nr:transcriptional repressor LexA [Armatimonadota bacterium]MDR5676528.1 transcriptional repressor LexA [Armatimonadota bacterium]MDR5689693.1 transcriptional repressor LexA [Armatimonadota bacterium]MDR7387697.1 transcriptional repressor LexA [Armatimonadota bacterium]MDR7389080.1 transcriptional repressor LexA [Armatimonadota bacterium]
MSRGLTRRQRQILDFVIEYTRRRGYPPSVRDIGNALHLTSSSTVHSHLSALEKKGYLRRDPSKPRAIEVLKDPTSLPHKRVVSLPVVGRVTAGAPILAEQNIEDSFTLPEDFVGGGECFLLRVRGDSMVGAGIYDGDYLVVRKQSHAQDGDIVVARIGDEATVKRFYREGDRIRLQPENPTMEPIYARDVVIEGKAVGLVRRL